MQNKLLMWYKWNILLFENRDVNCGKTQKHLNDQFIKSNPLHIKLPKNLQANIINIS